MKVNLHIILVTFAFNLMALAASAVAYGQDAQLPTVEQYTAQNSKFVPSDDEIGISDPEPKVMFIKVCKDSSSVSNKNNNQRNTTVKNTDSKSSSKSESESKAESKEDDSVLSFNFLYYIFQKYKLQDIVD